MKEILSKLVSVAIVSSALCMGWAVSAYGSPMAIRVLDTSGDGIAGVVILLNPGNQRNSRAYVSDPEGAATTSNLECNICTISAFDPQGRFVSRTTEFSGSSRSFDLVLQLHPVIDTVGDPRATAVELAIENSKGEQVTKHAVTIRPRTLTLENNNISVQTTDSKGHVNAQLRAGSYAVAALIGNVPFEAAFDIAKSKRKCSGGRTTCIVTSSGSPRQKEIVLRLLPAE